MKLSIRIHPTVIEGKGTLNAAKIRFRDSISGCFTCSSQFGSAWTNGFSRNITKVYGYNIQVFKRGKHRHNKHYIIYRYAFPKEIFNLLNIEISQGSRTFKITKKK